MNKRNGVKVKFAELFNSNGWYFKDLLNYIVIPMLGIVTVLAVLGFFKEQFYIVFNLETYLVWHNIFEFSSVVVSIVIFLLSWYAYEQLGNRRELFFPHSAPKRRGGSIFRQGGQVTAGCLGERV